jgi:hypothetical protein
MRVALRTQRDLKSKGVAETLDIKISERPRPSPNKL